MEAWLVELERNHPEEAWDRFLERYRKLIFAAIRHYLRDYDDVMDAFAHVCAALRHDDFRRLRSYAAQREHRARFSTWLVVVVRRLTVDWLRERHGRPRSGAIVETLTPLHRSIYEKVFIEGRPAGEAYELIRSGEGRELGFGRFLKELAAVHRAVGEHRPKRGAAEPEEALGPGDAAARAEARALLAAALGTLTAQDRAAVLLYVVEQLPASEVAAVLGLPNAKAVYNRVYRALAALRVRLEGAGIGPESV